MARIVLFLTNRWPLYDAIFSEGFGTDSLISTMVNGTVLNFGKRYEDNLKVLFYQWEKLNLGLDALSNQKILKGI